MQIRVEDTSFKKSNHFLVDCVKSRISGVPKVELSQFSSLRTQPRPGKVFAGFLKFFALHSSDSIWDLYSILESYSPLFYVEETRESFLLYA